MKTNSTIPNSHAADLLFVTATQAEAAPLIQHYRLKNVSSGGLTLFSGNSVHLVVCGIGALAAATATTHALASIAANSPSNVTPLAINIGIAGSDQPLGTLFYACSLEKYSARFHGKTIPTTEQGYASESHATETVGQHPVFYPLLACKSALRAIRVVSVDEPRCDYSPEYCFDMEAYGFGYATRRILSAEQAHCLKIISDNPQQPLATQACVKPIFPADQITELVAARINEIDTFASKLRASCCLSITPGSSRESRSKGNSTDHKQKAHTPTSELPFAMQECLAKFETKNTFNFSTTQGRQLSRLATRYAALEKIYPEPPKDYVIRSATDVINMLTQHIDQFLPTYGISKSDITKSGRTANEKITTERS